MKRFAIKFLSASTSFILCSLFVLVTLIRKRIIKIDNIIPIKDINVYVLSIVLLVLFILSIITFILNIVIFSGNKGEKFKIILGIINLLFSNVISCVLIFTLNDFDK